MLDLLVGVLYLYLFQFGRYVSYDIMALIFWQENYRNLSYDSLETSFKNNIVSYLKLRLFCCQLGHISNYCTKRYDTSIIYFHNVFKKNSPELCFTVVDLDMPYF